MDRQVWPSSPVHVCVVCRPRIRTGNVDIQTTVGLQSDADRRWQRCCCLYSIIDVTWKLEPHKTCLENRKFGWTISNMWLFKNTVYTRTELSQHIQHNTHCAATATAKRDSVSRSLGHIGHCTGNRKTAAQLRSSDYFNYSLLEWLRKHNVQNSLNLRSNIFRQSDLYTSKIRAHFRTTPPRL